VKRDIESVARGGSSRRKRKLPIMFAVSALIIVIAVISATIIIATKSAAKITSTTKTSITGNFNRQSTYLSISA
jgi:hypothetical protein